MTAATTSAFRTTTFHSHHEPSQRALATRSWTAAQRLTDNERSAAIRQHFQSFPPTVPPTVPSACRS